MKTRHEHWGTLPDGRGVTQWTVETSRDAGFSVIDFGCTLTSVNVPDRGGRATNVTLSFDRLEDYLDRPLYLGAVVGRFANRITDGRFTLDGRQYQLAKNAEGQAHLHGGVIGFDRRLWRGRSFASGEEAGVTFSYSSPDGEEAYPGTVQATVTYSMTESGELRLRYEATSTKPTPVNLTNHAYWNLAGSGSIHECVLQSPSRLYLVTDSAIVPTGEIARVEGTPLDFRTAKPIGRDIGKVEETGGYDHCYVVAHGEAGALDLACAVTDPSSGRRMEVWTTSPGFQLYTGNFLDGRGGSGGRVLGKHTACCVEAQLFPDCVNQAHFPSCILRPGETWRQLTVHRFSVV